MHDKSVEDWWELRMNGQVLTTVMSQDRAEWFLEKMRGVDLEAEWELVIVGKRRWAEPIKPSQARKRKVQYCVGSD